MDFDGQRPARESDTVGIHQFAGALDRVLGQGADGDFQELLVAELPKHDCQR